MGYTSKEDLVDGLNNLGHRPPAPEFHENNLGVQNVRPYPDRILRMVIMPDQTIKFLMSWTNSNDRVYVSFDEAYSRCYSEVIRFYVDYFYETL